MWVSRFLIQILDKMMLVQLCDKILRSMLFSSPRGPFRCVSEKFVLNVPIKRIASLNNRMIVILVNLLEIHYMVYLYNKY